ncbi:MAG TPA: sugar ABC transporter permease [Rectinemataceae bacterium]
MYLGFAGPSTFFFMTVIVLPFAFGIFLTFTNWDGISTGFSFVGLENYRTILSDKSVRHSFVLTLGYVGAVSLLTNIVGFSLAYILTSGVRGQSVYRVGFFTPNLIGGVVLGFLWSFIFSKVLVHLGQATGIGLFSYSWLGNPQKAFWALVLVTVWQKSGYLMIIYIAGIVSIPQEVLEAATMDGAFGLRKIKDIVIPLVMPSFVVCLFLILQKGFMVYELNLALTNGGPYGSTELISMNIYKTAFISEAYGPGQAQSILLFAIVVSVALLQVYFTKRLEVEM